MRVARILVPMLIALAATACARREQATYVIDPATGQPVPVVQQYGQTYQQPQPPPQYAQSDASRGLFASPQAAQQAYAPPQYAQQSYAQSYAPPQYAPDAPSSGRGLLNSRHSYAQPQYEQPAAPAAQPQYAQNESSGRGLFNSRHTYAQPQYAQPSPQQSYVLQYHPPQATGGPYAAAPYGYAYAPPAHQQAYTLDSGDKLRVVVFGQEGISGTYMVDAGGNISLPLVGTIPARGVSTQHLARTIGERLKQGYVREPHVTVTIEGYRPFFILGEVTTPGQYPFVPNMTVENAIAVAGGFSPRAKKDAVEVTRNTGAQRFTGTVPLNYALKPGDTVVVKERWF
jgi:polysaccharide export outer membrane protein